jgi:hypothetical protein
MIEFLSMKFVGRLLPRRWELLIRVSKNSHIFG